MPKKTAEVEITLRFLNEGVKEASEHVKLVAKAVSKFKNSIKGLDPSVVKGIMGTLAREGAKVDEVMSKQAETVKEAIKASNDLAATHDKLINTTEKVSAAYTKKMHKAETMRQHQEMVQAEIEKLINTHRKEIESAEKVGIAYKFTRDSWEKLTQAYYAGDQVIRETARKQIEAASAARVKNKETLIATQREKQAIQASREYYAAEEKRIKQTSSQIKQQMEAAVASERYRKSIKDEIAAMQKSSAEKHKMNTLLKMTKSYNEMGAQSLKRFEAAERNFDRVLASANIDLNTANNLIKKRDVLIKKATTAERNHAEKIRRAEEALKKKNATMQNSGESYRNFMSHMRDGVFLMEMFYRWAMRVVRSLIRLGQGLVQIVQEYAEFIRTVRSASFILRTSIENVVEATKKTTELGISMSEAAHGLDEFGRAGYTANDAIKAYTPIAIFAKAVNTNLSRATTLVTGAMKSFGFEAQDVWRIASGMTNAVYKSRNSFETLETAFAYAGASGAAFGQEFESVLSAIMAFRDLGLKASTSGTVFRRALSRLGAATKPTREAFQSFGIDIEKFTVSSDRSFAQVIRNFVKVRETMSELDFNELMSKAIGPRFAAYLSKLVEATKEGRINMEKAAEDLKNSMKTLFNLTRYNMSTITHQIDTFNAVMERAKFAFGKDLSNTFSPYLAAFNVFANKLLDKWTSTGTELEEVTDKAFKELSEEELAKRFDVFSKKVDLAMLRIINATNFLIQILMKFAPTINYTIRFITAFISILGLLAAGVMSLPPLFVLLAQSLWGLVKIIVKTSYEFGKAFGEGLKESGKRWINQFIDLIQQIPTLLIREFNKMSDLGRKIFKKIFGLSGWEDQEIIDGLMSFARNIETAKFKIEKPMKSITESLKEAGKASADYASKIFKNLADSNSVAILDNLGQLVTTLGSKIFELLKSDPANTATNSLIEFKNELEAIYALIQKEGLTKELEKQLNAAMKRGMAGGKPGSPMGDEEVFLNNLKEYEKLKQKLTTERFGLTATLLGDDEFKETIATWDEYIELNKLHLDKLRYEMTQTAKSKGIFSDEFKSLDEEFRKFENSGGFLNLINLKKDSVKKLEKILDEEKTYYQESSSSNIAILLEQEEKVAKFYDDHYKKIADGRKKAAEERQKALDKELQEDLKKHAAYYKELEKMRFKDLEYAKTLGTEQLSAMTEKFKQLEQGQDIGAGWRQFLESFDVGSKKYAEILRAKAENTASFSESINLSLEAAVRSWGTTREILNNTMMNIANTLQSGLQSVFTSLIDKTKDVKDAFKDMGKSILASLMAALSKMLVQRLIYTKLTEKLEKKQNAAGAKMVAAKAQTSAVARGWEVGPGFAGLIASELFLSIAKDQLKETTGPLGSLGFFNGTSMAGVPGTFTGRDNRMAPVSPGEVILDNNASDVFRNMAAGKGNMGGNSYMFNVYATDYESFKNKSEEVMIEAFTGNAKIRRAIKKSLKTQG